MTTTTHTRTHVHINFADPYLTCEHCGQWVTGYHDAERCGPGCDAGDWLIPCEHSSTVGVVSVCPSWGPVDGCQCQEHLGEVKHDEPPAAVLAGKAGA